MTIPKQLLEAKICNKNTCELQARIDKAIEYIKCGLTGDLDNDRAYIDENALLDILKGENDERI